MKKLIALLISIFVIAMQFGVTNVFSDDNVVVEIDDEMNMMGK